jgi:acetyltransferase-like isoleucine patch superfamily enzyme
MKVLYALLCFLPLAALADGDISKVNKSIRIETGQTAGDVQSVNGSVTIEDSATAQDVETVNGSITIGDRATVQKVNTVNGGIRVGQGSRATSIETVNGTLRIGEGAQIAEDVTAVNGSISLDKNANVSGRLENVNGRMSLDSAHVARGIETTNGDVEVGSGSRVEGGILVEKPNGHGWFNNNNRRTPTIIIGPNAVVEGELQFKQPVELYVSDTARIGKVTGATPVKFSGERPDRNAKSSEQVER